MKLLFDSGIEESISKNLTIEKYSTAVVRNFLDFVYLGPTEFAEKVMSFEINIDDIYSLLMMAHEYEVKKLVDLCTNLISLEASKCDLESLEELQTLYDNEHLGEILAKLHLGSNLRF
jgi:collagenase-like PrtC family protease